MVSFSNLVHEEYQRKIGNCFVCSHTQRQSPRKREPGSFVEKPYPWSQLYQKVMCQRYFYSYHPTANSNQSNRKHVHVPCFCRVVETRVEVWENEKCCGNTSRRRVFPQLFRVLPNFHECFYNSIETRYMFSISLRKHRDEKKENNLLTLIIKR